jgi:hypothetical protein
MGDTERKLSADGYSCKEEKTHVFGPCFCVARRELFHVFERVGGEILGLVERQEVSRRALHQFESVLCGQLQVIDDFALQQRHGVRSDGIAKAGRKLFGHCRSAHHTAPFQHMHLRTQRTKQSMSRTAYAAAEKRRVQKRAFNPLAAK